MWTFSQSHGEILQDDQHVAWGYSGMAVGKNNPAAQTVHDVGPIPLGFYDIGEPFDSKEHGPFVLPLTAHSGNQMFGRAGFLIHGDSLANPGGASKGCIVASKLARLRISESGDKLLKVVSGLKED